MLHLALETHILAATFHCWVLLNPLTPAFDDEKYAIHRAVTLPVQKLPFLQIKLKAIITVKLFQFMPTKRPENLKIHTNSCRLVHLLLQTVPKNLLIHFLR